MIEKTSRNVSEHEAGMVREAVKKLLYVTSLHFGGAETVAIIGTMRMCSEVVREWAAREVGVGLNLIPIRDTNISDETGVRYLKKALKKANPAFAIFLVDDGAADRVGEVIKGRVGMALILESEY